MREGPRLLVALGALFRDEAEALLASVGLGTGGRATGGTMAYGNQKQLELGSRWPDPRCCCSTNPPPGCRRARPTKPFPAATHRRRARLDAAVHRARHGGGVRHRGEDRRALPGPKLAEGAPEAVRANPEVRRVYLGTGSTGLMALLSSRTSEVPMG